MPTTIRMPQLGETVADGTILRWAKQVGDVVAEGDVLVEIATDKVDTEVPSPTAGTLLELLVAEGETVDVGAPIAVISGADEPVGEPAPAPAPVPAQAPTATSTPTPPSVPRPSPKPSPHGGRRLSPVVRRLAAEHGLDLGALTGTGPGGRITKADA
ncbi:MAG: dihydrolipoyllysine-residue succinyltransferase, partial [Acidimicrobiia bacterium]|nr:dihydrolipoyllysine-residue succinyltransferase [Acidimicrobiia bacterium]